MPHRLFPDPPQGPGKWSLKQYPSGFATVTCSKFAQILFYKSEELGGVANRFFALQKPDPAQTSGVAVHPSQQLVVLPNDTSSICYRHVKPELETGRLPAMFALLMAGRKKSCPVIPGS
jgi:hypothetical protein